MQNNNKNNDFVFSEHYKMNSGIFKNNFNLILQIMVADVYNQFSYISNKIDYPQTIL